MKTHRNIPFFVPHAGCPHCCVFCSQVKITGRECEKDPQAELKELRELLDSCAYDGTKESRIAFFGGSFTAIGRERMENLLATAAEYVKKGVASGIRISTRPDCIDEEVLSVLKRYGVTDIELGVQSTDDGVLSLSERGHTAADSYKAAKLVVKHGFSLCGQMMVGLPGATPESEVKTAKDIVAMGAKEARIYPTVVFEGTKLYDMTLSGGYVPLSTEEALDRTAKCFRVLHDAGVDLLRIGLHASENLAKAPFGATHPAIGELVYARVYEDTICERASGAEGKRLTVRVPARDISMFTGRDGETAARIASRTGASDVAIIPDPSLERFEIIVIV